MKQTKDLRPHGEGGIKCQACKGTGKVKTKDGKGKQACYACRGTGTAPGGYQTKIPTTTDRK